MQMLIEEWRAVPGYEGLYEVSNFGQVRSTYRTKKILSQSVNQLGYHKVTLYKGTIPKTHLVHRLVAQAFIPNPDNLPQINHIDEDPNNNCVNNLEWCTAQYNTDYSQAIEVSQFDMQGRWIRNYRSGHEAARCTNIDFGGINSCCLGRQNYAGGYIWRHAKPEYKEGYILPIRDLNLTGKSVKPIDMFDMKGNWIRTFESAREATAVTNIHFADICSCCKGRIHTAGGYIWKYRLPEYKEGYVLPIEEIPTNATIRSKVSMFDLAGNFIKTFDSAVDAMRELGLSRSDSISKCCKGVPNYNQCQGFLFRFYQPIFVEGYNLYDVDMNEAYNRPVVQINLNTNTQIHIHASSIAAYKSLGRMKIGVNGWQNIYQCCKGLLPAAFGYKWEFAK